MVLHRDFLMRSIQRLAAAFVSLVTRSATEPEEVREEIEDLVSEVLDTQSHFLFSVGPEVVETVDRALAVEIARLMFLHAGLEKASNAQSTRSMSLALAATRRAVSLGRTEAIAAGAELLREHAQLIAATLGPAALSDVWWEVFESQAAARAYADAEDAAFFALELGPAPERIDATHRFFESLLELADVDLSGGGLNRDEIVDIVDQVEGFREESS